jgi:hypothetical protein
MIRIEVERVKREKLIALIEPAHIANMVRAKETRLRRLFSIAQQR